MERLTIKPGICANASTEYCESQEDCYLCQHGKQMRFRLSAYEDTGLSPDKVEDIKNIAMGRCIAEITEFDGVSIARLKELVEADREGRCVVLPCKPGDKIYQLRSEKHAKGRGISPRFINAATVYSDGNIVMTHQGFEPCRKQDLGKTWFLSQEAAEKALEG